MAPMSDAAPTYDFQLTGRDRRDWAVTLTPEAVRYLTGRADPDEADLARLPAASGRHLELAALCQLARGRIADGRIELDASDFGRFPG